MWSAPFMPGGSVLAYDTIRSQSSTDFSGGGICVESGDGSDFKALDNGVPSPGGVFYYLVRAVNACPGSSGSGSLGSGTNGSPRVARTCP